MVSKMLYEITHLLPSFNGAARLGMNAVVEVLEIDI